MGFIFLFKILYENFRVHINDDMDDELVHLFTPDTKELSEHWTVVWAKRVKIPNNYLLKKLEISKANIMLIY